MTAVASDSAAAQAPDATLELHPNVELDLTLTLAPLAHGSGDPTVQLGTGQAWLAFRTPAGTATLHLRQVGERIVARAWGAGASAALDGVPRLIGLEDHPEALVARHPLIRNLQRRFAGVRLPASGRPFDALLPAILEQKITGIEARRVYRALIRRHGEHAPGPFRLRLAPSPATLAAMPYFAFHPLGLERRRAELLRRAAALHPRLWHADAASLAATLSPLAGIGPWTLAEVLRVSCGDPDAVSVGDYHIPNMVAWALAGEPRADDARMLELLEPYRGQRGRIQRLLELSGIRAPAYGPRMTPRRIATL